MNRVSRADAITYCSILTARQALFDRVPTGYEFRLPTEAEWEYCCRAGTTTEWSVGSSLSCVQANIDTCLGQPAPTVSYGANPWGVHNTHGNVWEWCLDRSDGVTNYPAGPVRDPYVSTGIFQIVRGGNYGDPAIIARSARRDLSFRHDARMGFRIVLAPILP